MGRIAIILVCIAALLLLMPFLLIAGVLIYAEDTGAPILKQKRVGKDKKTFFCYKLRTMRIETKEVPSHDASVDQITKIGRTLRSTGLDELPQIVNVLLGDMSFVGPRPCLPSQTVLIQARDTKNVFSVLPGITGLAQIQGVDMSQPEKLALIDAEYVSNRSLMLDLRIIWATVRGKGVGDAIKTRP